MFKGSAVILGVIWWSFFTKSATAAMFISVQVDFGWPPLSLVAYWGGFNPPLKFRSFDKAEPNSQFRGKCIRNNLIRIRVSRIRKLSGTPD
jgi:hypothetical protein